MNTKNKQRLSTRVALPSLTMALMLASGTQASSHREAPFIATMPQADATDFYMFRSYESGRDGYVTFLANYLPLQDAYGGPNYFDLANEALYQIHVDNNGDGIEDVTFSFQFQTVESDLQVPVNGVSVSVPLKNIGQVGPMAIDTDAVNVRQTYALNMIYGDRRTGSHNSVVNADTGSMSFRKPLDYIGTKSIPDYEGYANDHIYNTRIPGCDSTGKVFVGQRAEGFAINIGPIFDLVNLNPLAAEDSASNTLADKNVTTLALEVPITCLTDGSETVIGSWTTASIRQARVLNPSPNASKGAAVKGGAWTQVSRLGMPLVNEVVIGLKDKDAFNASEPKDDGQFATYVTNPTFPELLEILFPGTAVAPNLFPREDLIQAFLTGVPGLNQPSGVVASEMLRLNTGIDVTPVDAQANLGVLGGDFAGFPNGRRPGDDIIDAVLRVAMGALIADESLAPNKNAPLTDGATVSVNDFMSHFPYLNSPRAGSAQ
ncbi:MAG: DUF4331 domain-containing protein [Pseudomonadales bacterium]|nr:DUF4331 domain-containing protein [Pseudomonadales bacterium]